MNLEDVQKLKEAAESAQARSDAAKAAAAKAQADAEANPTDPAKAAASSVARATADAAAAAASETWSSWSKAERSVPAVAPNDWRVILLGLYLIVLLLGGVYFLAMLAMAVPPEKATKAMLSKCCPEGVDCPTPSPTPSSTPGANSNATVNSNTTSGDASAATNSNTNLNATTPTGTPQPTKTATPASQSNTNTNVPSANNKEVQEVLIPAIVCIEYVGRTSADGYLFLTVLFAGLVGAATRLVFSFVRHQGIRDFSLSWAWFYLFTPFSGATISLFLYYVIRGGFYGSAVGKPLALNIFAFFALGTLSGLFAENAMQKLREVAEVLLAKVPEKSKNPKNPNGD